MTDITGSRNFIQSQEVDFSSAVSESTLTRVGASINFLLNASTSSIGDVRQSMLTEAQFQSLNDTNWVRMDGRSVVGTDYEALTGNSNVPNLAVDGRFSRMAVSEGSLGAAQSSANKATTHSHDITVQGVRFDGNNSTNLSGFDYRFNEEDYNQGNETYTSTSVTEGDFEARPFNIAFNYFIKINS